MAKLQEHINSLFIVIINFSLMHYWLDLWNIIFRCIPAQEPTYLVLLS